MRWDNGCPECFGSGVDHGELCPVCKGRPSKRQRLRLFSQAIDELVQEGVLDPHVDPESGAVTFTVTASGVELFDHGRNPLACSITHSDEEDETCS